MNKLGSCQWLPNDGPLDKLQSLCRRISVASVADSLSIPPLNCSVCCAYSGLYDGLDKRQIMVRSTMAISNGDDATCGLLTNAAFSHFIGMIH